MNTILEGDRRFGVLLWDQVQGQPALVGCCAEIIQFQRMPDDRMKILTLGQQRFRISGLRARKALSGRSRGVD